jgi:hypothetical protein
MNPVIVTVGTIYGVIALVLVFALLPDSCRARRYSLGETKSSGRSGASGTLEQRR